MPDTFFAKAETAKQYKPKKVKVSKTGKLDCDACGLYKTAVYSPKMDVHGQGLKGILLLGEAPGPDEDEENDQWVGQAGKLLKKSLLREGIDLDRDCWRLNAANCYPGKDAKGEFKHPTNKQVACCKVVKVQPVIDELKPRYIVALGKYALVSLYAGRQSDIKISKYRGRAFPDQETGAWVLPLFHPSFINRKGKEATLESLWARDIERVALRVERGRQPVVIDPEKDLVLLTDFKELISVLKYVLKNAPWLVFDYESTGLKPYAPGHKIVAVGFATRFEGDDHISSYAFLLQHPEGFDPAQQLEILDLWQRIMWEPKIAKIAHNLKHEDMWTREMMGVIIQGWEWCTMVNTHIIDNERGITGLKFQAFLNWGSEDYGAHTKKFLTGMVTPEQKEAGDHVSTHSYNRIMEMPVEELLTYCGCDVAFTALLYEKQKKQIREGMLLDNARALFHEALLMFCDLQVQGVPIDEEYYDTKRAELEGKIKDATSALLRTREAKLFYAKEGRPIGLGSHPDLSKLLYEHLGHRPPKLTTGGSASVDAESLGMLDIPFTNKLIEIRKLDKIAGTYMDQIRRESVNGRVYPGTNFNIAATYRPTMDGPNFANTPKREEVARELVRRGIMADPGCKMMEADYGGIEVCGAGWYSKDRALLKYLHDPSSDMHRDQAQAIFDITPKEWNEFDKKAVKVLRFFSKNQFVFPEIYGSWFKECAKNLWKHCSLLPIGDGQTKVNRWLGMSYTQFEEHVRLHENVFWDQFRDLRKWQDSVSEEYIQMGYIETFLGFRYGGWLTQNKLYNYKIQGTAFHLLLWVMIQMHKMCLDRGWRSRLMWQIYDSMVWSIWPPEQEEVVRECDHMMTVEAPKKFPWINSSLKAEFEITGVDGTFADLKEIDETDNYEEE